MTDLLQTKSKNMLGYKTTSDISLSYKQKIYLFRASVPTASADLEILAHRALTLALSLSLRLMLACFSLDLSLPGSDLEFCLNSVGLKVTPTGTDAKPRPHDADRTLPTPA